MGLRAPFIYLFVYLHFIYDHLYIICWFIYICFHLFDIFWSELEYILYSHIHPNLSLCSVPASVGLWVCQVYLVYLVCTCTLLHVWEQFCQCTKVHLYLSTCLYCVIFAFKAICMMLSQASAVTVTSLTAEWMWGEWVNRHLVYNHTCNEIFIKRLLASLKKTSALP